MRDKVREELGKSFFQAGNLCVAATIFSEISGEFDLVSGTIGFSISLLLHLFGIGLINSVEK